MWTYILNKKQHLLMFLNLFKNQIFVWTTILLNLEDVLN